MRVQRRFAWVGMVAMAQLSAVGHAQSPPAPVSPQVQAQAKAYVDRGIAAQDAGQYDVAITYYQDAYRLVPHPLLIFNIAQAHRLAGRIDEAIEMYDRYLQKDPNGPQASTAQTLVAGLRARKAANREAPHADEARAASSMPATTGVPSNESPPTPGADLRLAGIVTGAAGAVAFGVAIRYGLRAASLSDELSEPNAVYSPAKVDEGHRDDSIAIAGWITGGVLVGTGVVLYYLGHQQGRHAPSLTLAPVVSDELTGVVVSGTLP